LAIETEKRQRFISPLERYNQKLRVRKCLCRVATDFDARLYKIRRVVLPVDGVANKRFVQQNMQILKDRQNEIESKSGLLQSSANISLNYMQQNMQTFKY